MSSYEIYKGDKVKVKAWVKGVPIESEAIKQLKNVASLSFIYKWIAAMPDVHWGRGATVGSVIPTKAAIIPAAVGVDIGCGMCAVQTTLKASDLPDDLTLMRHRIEKVVPLGKNSHEDLPSLAENKWKKLKTRHDKIIKDHKVTETKKSPAYQLGTLGGGNHFIEVCLDESDNVWVMLHSGSRNIGNRIGRYFTDLAKDDMKKISKNLPDADLAYFEEGTKHFNEYWNALKWAQDYAFVNREVMLDHVLNAIRGVKGVPKFKLANAAVNCHHNYAELENHYGENVYVTRKGAVKAYEGDLGIIPGSMGARSYIVRGKGNKESFCSCSHGAGRAMSRSAAKKKFSVKDHIEATKGVECRKDHTVLDETPMAYKDIDAVMAAQSDLVEVVHTLKQVLCVKG